MTWRLTLLLVALLLAAGCPSQDDDDSAGDDDTGDDDAADDDAADDDAGDDDTAAAYTVSGHVIRDTDLLAQGDGIGTLCIGILFSCGPDATVVGIQLDDADLIDDQVPVPFSIEIADGQLNQDNPYYMGAMFAEDWIDCETHELAGGEMINNECPTFVYEEASPITGIEIVLSTKIAFPG